jgi:5'-3' exonuclease
VENHRSRIINSCNKKWIIDFSYYIWAGSFAFTVPCKCGRDNSCQLCSGKGKLPLMNSRGQMTGGLYLVFQQIIDKLKDGWDVLLAFDPPREMLDRTKMLDSYKAQRGEKPEGIEQQMILGKELLNLIPNIECYSSDNAESDDTMAALAVLYANMGNEIVVASRDKDMFPLLALDNINIYRDGGIFTIDNFKTKFNFAPERFNEYLALAGDAVDNFNFFNGIGPKAAEWLICNTNHILEIYDNDTWNKIPVKYKKFLAKWDENGILVGYRKDELKLSLQLATLNYDANYYPTNLSTCKNTFKNKVEQLELKSVLKNLDILFGEI